MKSWYLCGFVMSILIVVDDFDDWFVGGVGFIVVFVCSYIVEVVYGEDWVVCVVNLCCLY